jgi:hypothetical protein
MRMSKDVAASQEAYRWMVDLSAVPPRLPNTRRVTAHHAADKRVPGNIHFSDLIKHGLLNLGSKTNN